VVKRDIGKAGEKTFFLCTRLTSICLKLSRALLYLGFLSLVRAVEEPKDLALSACLNHHAVAAYCEWSTKARQALNSSIAENLSAVIR
jgi:hypothetical protein